MFTRAPSNRAEALERMRHTLCFRRRMLSNRLLLASVLSITACTDAAEDPIAPPAPPPATPSAELTPRDALVLGSWDLAFDDGRHARVDVRGTSKNALEVALTAQWGRRRTTRAVSLFDESLGVSGTILFESGLEYTQWTSIRIARGADGSFSGRFSANGTLRKTSDGKTTEVEIAGGGTITPDAIAPEARIAGALWPHGDKFFPWERIRIELSEPIMIGRLKDAFAESAPDLVIEPADSSTTKLDPREETTSIRATPQDLRVTSRTLTLDAVRDLNGNVIRPLNVELPLHSVGAARARHDFSAPTEIALWGDATRVTDPRCESGSCLLLPKATMKACDGAGGAAMLVELHGATRVKVRTRLLTSAELPEQSKRGSIPRPEGFVLLIGVPQNDGPHGIYPMDVKVEHTGTGDLPWQSPWMTLEASIPAAALKNDVIGIEIHRANCQPEAKQDESSFSVSPMIDAEIASLIESVWTE